MKVRVSLSGLCCGLLICWCSHLWAQDVYYKDKTDQWVPAVMRTQASASVVTFSLDPSNLTGGRTVIMIGLDPTVAMNDRTPPRLTGLKLDGRPLPLQNPLDLDWLGHQPRTLAVGFRDAENRLDPGSLTVRVNGQRVPTEQMQLALQPDGHGGVVTVDLAAALSNSKLFHNTIAVTIADRSPEQLATTAQLAYYHLIEVQGDPQIVVDSCFSGYTDVDVLVDGEVQPTNVSTAGVTWASEEVPGDHWVVLAWPAPRQIQGLELHWAYWRDIYWTSHSLRVEWWDGERWVVASEVTDLPQAAMTKLELSEFTTDKIRLTQPDGQGRPGYGPNIFWLSEITVIEP